ncbi:NADP-dependent malic enzyme [Chromobacterium violaceum]|uniref:NADP-dependent malic enzyme n=1 Tax=Chromobacterium violaceum TaxID=536 RepID=A0A3S4HJE4_CHRVL|nr:NADP-dependent malic enzyme [Chromobacterium violaceum]
MVFVGRDEKLDESKLRYAIQDNGWRKLADAMAGADIFMGLSGRAW